MDTGRPPDRSSGLEPGYPALGILTSTSAERRRDLLRQPGSQQRLTLVVLLEQRPVARPAGPAWMRRLGFGQIVRWPRPGFPACRSRSACSSRASCPWASERLRIQPIDLLLQRRRSCSCRHPGSWRGAPHAGSRVCRLGHLGRPECLPAPPVPAVRRTASSRTPGGVLKKNLTVSAETASAWSRLCRIIVVAPSRSPARIEARC